jgi:hypothetical protein
LQEPFKISGMDIVEEDDRKSVLRSRSQHLPEVRTAHRQDKSMGTEQRVAAADGQVGQKLLKIAKSFLNHRCRQGGGERD